MRVIDIVALCSIPLVIGSLMFAGRPTDQPSCVAIDGDTLDCGSERIRLNGIDAAELGTRSGGMSKSYLAFLIAGRKAETITRYKTDRYGRTVADVRVGELGIDLSCTMLEAGQAVYVPQWDEGGNVIRRCGP